MAPQDGRRGGPESGGGEFAGRNLLVGRPEGVEGRRAAGAAGTAQATTSPPPGAQDDAIREILETVRETAARIDALRDAPGPEPDTAEALARETAALTQAAEDARGALARAAELAAPPPHPQPPADMRNCPRCGNPTIVRQSSEERGFFLGCTSFPKCLWTRPFDERARTGHGA